MSELASTGKEVLAPGRDPDTPSRVGPPGSASWTGAGDGPKLPGTAGWNTPVRGGGYTTADGGRGDATTVVVGGVTTLGIDTLKFPPPPPPQPASVHRPRRRIARPNV